MSAAEEKYYRDPMLSQTGDVNSDHDGNCRDLDRMADCEHRDDCVEGDRLRTEEPKADDHPEREWLPKGIIYRNEKESNDDTDTMDRCQPGCDGSVGMDNPETQEEKRTGLHDQG